MKYKLKFPIVKKGKDDRPDEEIIELNLVDRMKSKHAKLIPDDCYEENARLSPTKFIPVIAAMAGMDIELTEELDFVDLVKIVGEIVSPFLSELS